MQILDMMLLEILESCLEILQTDGDAVGNEYSIYYCMHSKCRYDK